MICSHIDQNKSKKSWKMCVCIQIIVDIIIIMCKEKFSHKQLSHELYLYASCLAKHLFQSFELDDWVFVCANLFSYLLVHV